MRTNLGIRNLFIGTLVAVVILWTVIPIYGVVLISISPSGEFSRSLLDMPNGATIRYFKEVLFGNQPVWRAMVDSISIGIVCTLVVLILGIPISYSFSRYKTRLTRLISYFMLFLLMIPPIALILPFFMLIQKLYLIDTILGISLAHIAWNIPFGTWLMKGFFDQIPTQVEEAAKIDGASTVRIIIRITLPLVTPGIAVTASFIFLFSYIEYICALTLSRSRVMTVPVRLAGYVAGYMQFYQPMAAAIIISTVPMIIIYVIVRRWLVQGVALGSF